MDLEFSDTFSCGKCGVEKSLSEFHLDRNNKQKIYTVCKLCQKEIAKKQYIKNRDKRLKYASWYRKNRYFTLRASRFNSDHNSNIKKENIEEMIFNQKDCCNICGISIITTKFDIDHKIPKKLGGSSNLENLQLLCWKCNRGKYVLSQEEYISHCKKVAEKN